MRIPALAVAALLLTLAAAAQPEVDPLTSEERAWLDAHGPIRYAPDPDYPPFEFVTDDGTVQGINVDFLNRFSRNLDISFETVVLDNWTAVLEAMQAGEVDLLGSLAQNEEREAYMDFYGPYMSVGEVFYVAADRTDLASEQDLVGQKVAVVGSYAAGAWLAENRPELELVPVDDIQAGLDALTTGEVDAFFENVPVTGYLIRDLSYSNIRILGEPLYFSAANWGVQEGNEILLSIIDKGMASVPLGEQTRIFEYWTGYDLGVARDALDGPLFSPVALGALAGVALLAALAAAFVWVLRRQVHARTGELTESRNALVQANDDLEHRVDERTLELSTLSDRLSEVYAVLADAARTSARSTDMFSKQIRSRYHGIIKKQDMDYLTAAMASSGRIHDLVEDLGHLSATGPVAFEEVDLVAQFRSASTDIRSGTQVAIEADAITVMGDPDALSRLAHNVVRHAVQVGDGGNRITIKADDAGVAIWYDAPDDVRLTASTLIEPLASGKDLGLAAAARIMHRHGADLRVSDEDGRLCLHLGLEAHTGEAPSAARPPRPGRSNEPKKAEKPAHHDAI